VLFTFKKANAPSEPLAAVNLATISTSASCRVLPDQGVVSTAAATAAKPFAEYWLHLLLQSQLTHPPLGSGSTLADRENNP
jgi:hypothetical protein